MLTFENQTLEASEHRFPPCQDIDIRCVDLFCGAGGLTQGLEKAGVQVSLGIDHNPLCEMPYESNNEAAFALTGVEAVSSGDLDKAWGDAPFRLLVGCAPCQPFSTYSRPSDTPHDQRRPLLGHFSRLVAECRPHLVAMENVPLIGQEPVFNDFCHTLAAHKYHMAYGILNCADYDVPQRRKRLILLASRLGRIHLPAQSSPFYRKTVGSAIGNLPPLKAGEVSDADALHQASALSDVNLERIRASAPGKTWRDWPPHLIIDCHRSQAQVGWGDAYGRMGWDEPAPTITTKFFNYSCGRFGHPQQDRALSLREGALLQSFPREYQFVPQGHKASKKAVARMIGNAVPPKLGEAIGEAFIEHVGEWTASKHPNIPNGKHHHIRTKSDVRDQ